MSHSDFIRNDFQSNLPSLDNLLEMPSPSLRVTRTQEMPNSSSPHLSSSEPPAFRKILARASYPFLLSCDHASNRVPRYLGNLGLPADELNRHIGWDIGAAHVTELIAERLGAAAILANYSRLVIDLNRDPGQDDFVPPISDGTLIPSNQHLTLQEKDARQALLHEPYHNEIAVELLNLKRRHPQVALVSIHSFTPALHREKQPRPWQIGLMWKHDRRSFEALRDYLETHTDLIVGDNEPYSMFVHTCYTERRHTELQQRASLMIEIRQDEILTETGQHKYAELLTGFLKTYQPPQTLSEFENESVFASEMA